MYSFDITDQNQTPELIAETTVEGYFKSIAWDNFGVDGDYPMGIIAGGMNEGTLSLWDPSAILSFYKHKEENAEIEIN